MKRMIINKNEVGLVLKNNTVKRVLTEGKYWLGFGETVVHFTRNGEVKTAYNIDLLMSIPEFAALVDVFEVADLEIGLLFVNKNFQAVLTAGRHYFWKGVVENRVEKYNVSELEIPKTISRDMLLKGPLQYYVRSFEVNPSEKALFFVDGEFVKELGPGTYMFWKNSIKVEIKKADMRLNTLELNGQEILTKDKAQIRVNFTAQYQVVDLQQAILENKDYLTQLYNLMQFGLRAYLGNMTLDAILENKEGISDYILNTFEKEVKNLGLKLSKVGVKDIILPGDIREIMNQVLVAEKRAQANIITRREETASTRSLLNTAKLLEENNMLYRLKEMEYMEKIADKINSISVSGNGQVLDQLKQLFVK